MKTIASFGQFVRDTWLIWVVSFSLAVWILMQVTAKPSVTLDSKWECTLSRPAGLGAMCLEYQYKGK
jgi:hypothetical protein